MMHTITCLPSFVFAPKTSQNKILEITVAYEKAINKPEKEKDPQHKTSGVVIMPLSFIPAEGEMDCIHDFFCNIMGWKSATIDKDGRCNVMILQR